LNLGSSIREDKKLKRINGWFVLALVGILALAACGPVQEIPITGDDLPAAAEAARQQLANTLGIDITQIQVVAIESTEWPDACLGLPDEGEVCAQVITPGYELTMEVNQQEYVIRTDQTGEIIRSVDVAGILPQ
jgi:hypothetical protein